MPDPSLPPLLPDETQRLAALQGLEILDTAPDPELDIITRLAADRFDSAIALVSLVDERRQWFKSRQGLDVCQTPREHSICAHAIAGDGVMVVPDATQDPRFAANPLVTGEPNIRFYAAAPLVTSGGYRIGTLCVIDERPRDGFHLGNGEPARGVRKRRRAPPCTAHPVRRLNRGGACRQAARARSPRAGAQER